MKKIISTIIAVCAIAASSQFALADSEYVNTSGKTIGDIFNVSGFATYEEFLTAYGLPSDLSPETEEATAYYSIPTSVIADMYGLTMDELRAELGLGSDVTENTPWGEAEGKSPLKAYVGEEMLDEFKKEYGFGDEVTGETLWGEVRNAVALKDMENSASQAAAAEEKPEVTILINGEELKLDAGAYIKDDRTMVPLRGVFEAVGATVSWEGDTKTAFVTKENGDDDKTFIFLQIGSDKAFVNSEEKALDVPAEIASDRTMVPLRFIMEELGAKVDWDGATKTVSITTD